MPSLRFSYCAFAFALAVVSAGAVRADQRPEVVILVPEAQADAMADVAHTVRAYLSDLDVELEVLAVPELEVGMAGQISFARDIAVERGALGVFWSDILERQRIILYLSDASGERVLVRDLQDSEDSRPEETLAIIIRSSVAELLAGGEIGIAVSKLKLDAEEPEEEPAPEPPPAEQPPRRLGLQVGFAGFARDGDHLFNPGLDLGIDYDLIPEVSIGLGYTVLAPISGEGSSTTIELRRHPMRAWASWKHLLERVALGLGAALVVDYSSFDNVRLVPGASKVDDRDDWVVSALPFAALDLLLVNDLVVFLNLAAEITFNGVEYTARTADGSQQILGMWPVLPWLVVGLRAKLL